jgi:hypothetical protein
MKSGLTADVIVRLRLTGAALLEWIKTERTKMTRQAGQHGRTRKTI